MHSHITPHCNPLHYVGTHTHITHLQCIYLHTPLSHSHLPTHSPHTHTYTLSSHTPTYTLLSHTHTTYTLPSHSHLHTLLSHTYLHTSLSHSHYLHTPLTHLHIPLTHLPTHSPLTLTIPTVCDFITLMFRYYRTNGTTVFLKRWKNGRSCCPTETIEERYVFRRFSEQIRWRREFDYARPRALQMRASFHPCLIAP